MDIAAEVKDLGPGPGPGPRASCASIACRLICSVLSAPGPNSGTSEEASENAGAATTHQQEAPGQLDKGGTSVKRRRPGASAPTTDRES
eukprot:8607674-Pyramimonas_sp.AAC.1